MGAGLISLVESGQHDSAAKRAITKPPPIGCKNLLTIHPSGCLSIPAGQTNTVELSILDWMGEGGWRRLPRVAIVTIQPNMSLGDWRQNFILQIWPNGFAPSL